MTNFDLKMGRKHWTDEKLFWRLINNKSDKTYWDNVRELRYRGSASVFNYCVKLMKSTNAEKQIIGINVLSHLGPKPLPSQLGRPLRPFVKESIKLFYDILRKNKNPEVITAVMYAIGHNNEELKADEIKRLVFFKGHVDKDVRAGLVVALRYIEKKIPIDTLIYLSKDKISSIRDWATFYVGQSVRNNKSMREALWLRVADKHEMTRLEAIAGLIKKKDPGIKEIVKRELLTGEFPPLFFEVMGESNDQEYLPLLKKELKRAKKDSGYSTYWLHTLKDCIKELESKA